MGDRIPLSVFRADGDVYDDTNHSLFDEGEYEIIGITNQSEDWPFWVFLPDSHAADRGITTVNGYTLGQFRLKNAGVSAFLEAAAPLTELGEQRTRPLPKGLSHLRIFIDRSSVEIFVNDGDAVFSSRIFPAQGEDRLRLEGDASLHLWEPKPAVTDDFKI